MNNWPEKHYYGECKFVCEIYTGPNCDGGIEIRKVDDPSIELQVNGKTMIVPLSDFRNHEGLTISELLQDKEHAFTLEMVKKAEERGY